MKLPRAFFARDTRLVTRDLLGMKLVRIMDDGTRLSGRIVETEAYRPGDRAAHSFRGPTTRTAPMFGEAGLAYVYFTYGMHFCFNVVTEEKGIGAAVLVRALEPLEGIERMRAHYPIKLHDLCRGPARLCKAMRIDRVFTGYDMLQDDSMLFIEQGEAIDVAHIATSPRIGVSGDELAKTTEWRWFVRNSKFVSHQRLALKGRGSEAESPVRAQDLREWRRQLAKTSQVGAQTLCEPRVCSANL
jgi:DNA-3-methyladenine glycosylase